MELVLEEADVFVPEGMADVFPMFFVVDQFYGVQQFVVDIAHDEPHIHPPLILVPPTRHPPQQLVLVPTYCAFYFW